MFDRITVRTKSPRWKTAIIIGTAAGHAAVISALVIAAFWKIDALPVTDHTDIKLGVHVELPPPGGPPPGARLEVRRAAKVKPPVDVQPVEVAKVDPPIETGPVGPTGTGTPGGGGDNPGGDPDSHEIGTGTCAIPPCGEVEKPKPDPDPPVQAKVEPPAVVPPSVAAGLRLSGNDKIYPSDPVRTAIVRDGKDQVRATVKLCVGRDGGVDSVRLLQPTGYAEYDAALVREMGAWTYKPYLVNGTPAPMCTVAIVLYRLQR